MDERTRPTPTPTTGASSTTEEILAAIAAEELHGAPADHVARAIGPGLDGEMVQAELEELVARGLLDRRGLGLDAIYTLAATGATETTA
jgi:hypothetical protein